MNEFFTFERTMFRRDEFGELLFFGYPLFGAWLPFIGFRQSGALKTFDIEWFLRGIRFCYKVDWEQLYEDSLKEKEKNNDSTNPDS